MKCKEEYLFLVNNYKFLKQEIFLLLVLAGDNKIIINFITLAGHSLNAKVIVVVIKKLLNFVTNINKNA